MEEEGLTSIYPMSELSVMGLVEVVPGLARVLRRLTQTARHLLATHPDVLVTIDSQAFSRRLAERIHPAPFPVVHYVGPTVWAWRPSRIRKVSSVVDRLAPALSLRTILLGGIRRRRSLCRSSPG